ncbi:UPF0758 protein [Caligus rogercresseyi]|uniref:UPF0758 protein n=1 Tax=Caligus rogercresseyi TaxID=217165 RepID=A0A7T8H1X2_CALRO|nr:UPF0758 protein [Caligus rogercresseyi]
MSDQPTFTFDEASPQFLQAAPVAPRKAAGPSKGAEDHRLKHRDRLRARFTEGGADAVPDYELLEMILYGAILRGDTKRSPTPDAHFGDLNRVLAAPKARLKEVEGVGDKVIFQLKLIEATGHRMARAKVIQKRSVVLGRAAGLLPTAMAHRDLEQFRVLYLDRKNVLVADEAQAMALSIMFPFTRAKW